MRRVGDQTRFQHFGELGQRVLARHHRAQHPAALEAGAGPQRAPLDHRQQSRHHQRGLAGTAVALDLQPALVTRAGAAQPLRIPLALIAQGGEGLQRLLAPPEEQPGLARTEGAEAEKRAAGDHQACLEAAGAAANRLRQAVRQRSAG